MKRALISVFHKSGIEEIAKKLSDHGWEIISTGGTAAVMKKAGIEVTEVASLTDFPEILDGRVKTLHPAVFGPILAKKSSDHLAQLEAHGLGKIDLVIVNFYPFEEALASSHKGLDFMIENIDIGGPSMVRAAAKNFKDTAVVVEASDYQTVVDEMVENGDIDAEKRQSLAQKAFAYTSFYDSLIANYLWLGSEGMPPYINFSARLAQTLRYGENPHQQGAMYIRDAFSPMAGFEQLQGKSLSFNNILDASMVYEVVNEFSDHNNDFCVVVKHQNPCGAASADSQSTAFANALAGDPKSAFGGIVGFNRPLDEAAASQMKKIFFEVIIAPDFTADALAVFRKKKNLRLLKMKLGYLENDDIKTIPGGLVLQNRDNRPDPEMEFTLKTSRQYSPKEEKDIQFGWTLIKYVKSNGIIIVKDRTLIGVGAGQMSRVDAVDIALRKSQFPLDGSVLLSDAFFPFADSVELAAKQGIKVVVEPGGSVRDDEVISEAEKSGISLVFTGKRHFRH